MGKVLTIKKPSLAHLYRVYLSLWQTAANLSDREADVLAVVLAKRTQLIADGLKEPYLSEYLFNTRSRKEYCDELDISIANFQNILLSLKKKNIITDGIDSIHIDPRLLPQEEITFKFILDDGQ